MSTNDKRFLEVTLGNPVTSSEKVRIHFELLDTDMVNRWHALMDRAVNARAPIHSSWGMHTDESKKPGYLEKLNYHIAEFNKLTEPGLHIPHHVDTNITQDILNEIHTFFDLYYYSLDCDEDDTRPKAGKRQKSKDLIPVATHLHQINALVHMLESILEVEFYKRKGLICAWFSARYYQGTGYGYFSAPLKENDYDHFTLAESFGDVFLNYPRAGKSLFDIYLNDDLDVLEKGFPAKPAKSISAGIIALFGNYVKNHKEELARFHEWWDAKNIDRYGYRKGDKKHSLGYIKVGRLCPNPYIQHLFDEESGCFDEFGVVEFYKDYSDIVDMKITYNTTDS